MDCKVITLIGMIALRGMAQSYQMNELSIPTNGTVVAPPLNVQAPVANPWFAFYPENNTASSSPALQAVTNLVTDPQGINVTTTPISNATNGNNGLSIAHLPNTSVFFLKYAPSNNLTGTDGYQYYGFNSELYATNSINLLVYDTNFTQTSSSINYSGKGCSFLLPKVNGLNYFFSVYSQGTFSNLYYFNNANTTWGKVQVPSQFPDSFPSSPTSQQQFEVVIVFPTTESGLTMTANLYVSNAPCTMPPVSQIFLTAITNSQNTFNLLGSVPTYIVLQAPTNGYTTNLNSSTGQITYVETNSSATSDLFVYCTSNSPVCEQCSSVHINIITSDQITCGNCFGLGFNGGIVTGNIFFNTGVSNENVCVHYTNSACVSVTNCVVTDVNGTAKFFVNIGCGDTNYCIVQLGTCANICYFSHANVSGEALGFDGDYYLSTIFFNGTDLQTALTNSNGSQQVLAFDSSGNGGGNGFCCGGVGGTAEYCLLEDFRTCLYYETATKVFNADCSSFLSNNAIGGWTNICGVAPVPIVTFDTVSTIPNCVTNCP